MESWEKVAHQDEECGSIMRCLRSAGADGCRMVAWQQRQWVPGMVEQEDKGQPISQEMWHNSTRTSLVTSGSSLLFYRRQLEGSKGQF